MRVCPIGRACARFDKIDRKLESEFHVLTGPFTRFKNDSHEFGIGFELWVQVDRRRSRAHRLAGGRLRGTQVTAQRTKSCPARPPSRAYTPLPDVKNATIVAPSFFDGGSAQSMPTCLLSFLPRITTTPAQQYLVPVHRLSETDATRGAS